MGGISPRAVDCAEFSVADAIDTDFENYIINGLVPEAEIMIYYSWYWWAMYVWNVNTQLYFTTMQGILECAATNEIEDSKYGNTDYMEGTWQPAVERMG